MAKGDSLDKKLNLKDAELIDKESTDYLTFIDTQRYNYQRGLISQKEWNQIK